MPRALSIRSSASVVVLFGAVVLVGCPPRAPAPTFSCPEACAQRTGYGSRCDDMSKDATYCQDLANSAAPGWKGAAAGTQRLPCGCWSFTPALGWRDPTCASNNGQVEACAMGCMGGGLATRVVCS
jgi:hypothetical protein